MEIKFIYEKGTDFKVHQIDGVLGGTSPHGDIFLNFFSERFPIPETVSYELLENDKLGKEIEKDVKNAIIRELECGIILNIETAKKINEWLSQKITENEKVIKGK